MARLTANRTLPRLAVLAILALPACTPDDGEAGGRAPEADVSSTGVVMRAWPGPPDGAVPRGAAARRAALAEPGPAITSDLIDRGKAGFATFCTPCHGRRGHGDGPVADRGFPRPPSYHEPRLQALTPAAIVAVITHGRGAMWPYAGRVQPDMRWAIAHYVKRLQAEETATTGKTEGAP